MISQAKPNLGQEEIDAVTRVLASGKLAQGEEVGLFENEFSEVLKLDRACIAVNSGTSALHLALLAMGVKAGDEVIVPSFTFAATANAVALTGATPVFADIELTDFCISPSSIESKIGPRTVGIVPVHLYGHPADMEAVDAIAQRESLFVLEDAAQAHGARTIQGPVGALGTAAAFSFYPTKNMTSGEGGMVVTKDESLARTVRLLRNQGQEQRYKNEIVGLNNRMTDIHAAIGRVQLRKLMLWNQRRSDIARTYDQGLANVEVPMARAGVRHAYHQYTIRIHDGRRDEVKLNLESHGIGCGIYYPTPVHKLDSYATPDVLLNTERAAGECLSLPMHPLLSDEEVAEVISVVNGATGT